MRRTPKSTTWHPDQVAQLKRIAIHVVALLPDDQREALAVLAYSAELINDFLGEETISSAPKMAIVRNGD
jgi:hypothetical protein